MISDHKKIKRVSKNSESCEVCELNRNYELKPDLSKHFSIKQLFLFKDKHTPFRANYNDKCYYLLLSKINT